MLKCEIIEGGVYLGKGGRKRKVLAFTGDSIFQGQQDRDCIIYREVYDTQTFIGTPCRMTRKGFASWAKERIE